MTPELIRRDPKGRFWADDFDCDLFKVVPDARHILEEHGQVLLRTRGRAKDGRLHHPTCWNSDRGFAAFFSFEGDPMPPGYYANDPIVECTFEEAIRDAWAHTLAVIIGPPWPPAVWIAGALGPDFTTLLYHQRKWRVDHAAAEKARQHVGLTLIDANEMFTLLLLARKRTAAI